MLKINEIYKIISKCTEGSSNVSAKQVREVFTFFNEIVRKQLTTEGETKLPYLGKLKVKIGKERLLTDPKTNQVRVIPPRPKVRFSPCKEFKEEIGKIQWEYKDEEHPQGNKQ